MRELVLILLLFLVVYAFTYPRATGEFFRNWADQFEEGITDEQ